MIGPIFEFATEVLRIWGKFIDRHYIDKFAKLKDEYRAAVNAPETNQALIDDLVEEIKNTFLAMTNNLKTIEAQK